MSERFPRYGKFDPLVPVWCVTPDAGGSIIRFFNTPAFSPSGRYLAVFRLPYEDRMPQPGDAGQVVLIDLAEGTERVVAETRGWEAQLGANVNWGGDDHTLFFNDVDPDTWDAFAVRLDPLTGESRRMGGCVYHASADGRYLVSACVKRMRRTQPGYGVMIPDELVPRNLGASEDDGIYITDTETGECRMLVSLAEAIRTAQPRLNLGGDANEFEIYGFHSAWNPRGDRLFFSMRWYPAQEPRFDVLHDPKGGMRFAVFTIRPDGKELYLAVPPEEWEKVGHHTTFLHTGRKLTMNLDIHRNGLRFVHCNLDGTELKPITEKVLGSGHPSIHPDGRHILTDTYVFEEMAFGDGTIPLRWVDIETGEEKTLVRINSRTPNQEQLVGMRLDPHPTFDREWRWIAFNAYENGARRVFVADLQSVIG
ncbi:MAG: hypothetical protein JXA11_08615 [Phycisphaerae bacterium]|nr:hypothetical protein [Phycisphaerae bacterium]